MATGTLPPSLSHDSRLEGLSYNHCLGRCTISDSWKHAAARLSEMWLD
jgi:hypothetical protein